ncbi:MAG: glycosyltransferase family 2 protein [Candidatus Marinimicrobia bacterium]|nr:glycosyltransferase family 2 protein [Candidatus Neomarinimicrobiota bacterium]
MEVVILNWNGLDIIKPCLDSVLANTYTNYSVTIVDNHSDDGSVEMIKKEYPQIHVVELDKNYLFAGGYNRYFQSVKSSAIKYVMLLNNDTIVDKHLIEEFVSAAAQYGEDNIYGGKIFYHDQGDKIWYAGGSINLKLASIKHIGIREKDSPRFSTIEKTDYVTGCCLFTSLNTIQALNGFDESFNMYVEDVDFCIRAKQMGVECYFWPNATLQHRVSSSMGGNYSLKKIGKKMKGLGLLLHKHGVNN